MMQIKVVIIEDVDEIRNGYQFLINSSEDFCCVAYPNAEDAIHNLLTDKPDVAIMDINLPGMTGIEATRIFKSKMPALQIMMFTIYENNENVFNALEAGASGYILKQTKPTQILEAVKDIYHGGAPMSSQIAKMVVNSFQSRPSTEGKNVLTEREDEVLRLLAAGYRNKDVAEKLFISISTVKTHVYSIYQKLHVTSRVEAVNKLGYRRK
jgi:DNA-binding NarL/FixJ family response regulator